MTPGGGGLYNPVRLKYVEIDGGVAANHATIVGGGAAWVDTDFSASQVPRNAVAIVIIGSNSVGQSMGARYHGSPQTSGPVNSFDTIFTVAWLTTGHIDLLRSLIDNNYYIMGFWI
jgi:hypothetical protein